MRRKPLKSALCGLALLLLLAPSSMAQTGTEGGLRGDVNLDGSITALDALAVMAHVVGRELPAGYVILPNGDADGSGEASAVDALVILSFVVGKDVSRYPVGNPLASALETAGGDGQTGTAGRPPLDSLRVRAVDRNGKGVPGVTVTWTVVEGGGSVSPTAMVTGSDGVAKTAFTLGLQAGVNRASAGARGLDSVVFTLTAASGAPATVTAMAGQGQTAVAGSAVAAAPSVQVRDAHGNPVPDAAVRFRVASGGGSVTDSLRTTDAAGTATVGSWTLGTTAGANTLQARVERAAGDTVATTFDATGVAGAAAKLGKEPGDGGSAVVGTTRTLRATVVDAYANPVSGHTVEWAVASGGGSLSAASTGTNAGGVAEVVWTLGTTAGEQSATASSAGLAGSPLTFTVAATPAPAAKLALATQPSAAAQSGAPLPTQPVLQLQDAHGNAVGQAGVEVTAAIASGGGTLGGTATVATSASGQATFTDLAITGTAGDRELGFSAAELAGATSDVITLTAGAAASLVKHAGDGQTAAAGTAVATAPAVQVTDASGNPVPGVAVTFAVASGGGSVTDSLRTTDAAGVAAVGSWTLGTAVGSNTLTATAGALSTTFGATGTAGAAATLAIQSGDGGSAVIGTTRTLEAKVADAHGNPVSGHAVSWAVASGGGSVSVDTASTDTSGIASVNWTFGTTAGEQSATATSTGLNGSPLTFTVTTTAGAASTGTSTITAASDSITANGTASTAITVQLRDADGNNVTSSGGTVALSTTAGTLSPVTDNDDGTYTATLKAPATVGSATVSGTLDGTALAGADTVRFVAGPAAKYVLAASDSVALVGGSVTVTAQLADSTGNPVAAAGRTVTWASTGGGTFSSATSSTDTSGIATVTFTVGSTADVVHAVTGSDGSVPGDSVSVRAAGAGTERSWTGAASTGWSTAGNWSPAVVPDSASRVTIPASASNQPVLSAGASVEDLTLASGSTLGLGAFSLRVYGSADASGTIGNGTLWMSGPGATLKGTLNALLVTGDISLQGGTKATGAVSVQGGVLTVAGQALSISIP